MYTSRSLKTAAFVALAVLVGIGTDHLALSQTSQPMRNYEQDFTYRVVTLSKTDTSGTALQAKLNDSGAQGWKLVPVSIGPYLILEKASVTLKPAG